MIMANLIPIFDSRQPDDPSAAVGLAQTRAAPSSEFQDPGRGFWANGWVGSGRTRETAWAGR